MRTITILLSLILFTAASCDRPECKNNNPVFDRYPPQSVEYKAELAKQIRLLGVDKLSFWFDGYAERSGDEYILARIQGAGLCALGELLVHDWSGIEGLRGDEPNGYEGAELRGVKLDIDERASGANLVFKGLERIID